MKLIEQVRAVVALLALFPPVLLAQNEPVIVEAEDAMLGTQFNLLDENDLQYISITPAGAGGNPANSERVAIFVVNFPRPGTYELYARLRVGPANFSDDSFCYGNGFGAKAVSVDNTADGDWILANQLASGGYTLPNVKVTAGGIAQSGMWKWMKLSAFNGGEPPVGGFEVTEGNLTQTFQIGGREDGLDLDKFAFGPQGILFTVHELDNGLPGNTEPPPPPYVPPGPPIATGQEKFLGCGYGAAEAPSFDKYWNKVTPGNAGKWGSVESTRDVMNWAELDAAYNLAKSNNFPFHFHVLVWGNQQPAWIETLPPAEQLEEIHEWFAAVAARYPDLDFVEVVNEPLHDPPNQSGNGGGNYIEALGGSGATSWDWIINAFRIARTYFPDSKLMINEYSVTNTPADMQRYISIIRPLQAENLIDAVGVQGHAFSTRPNVPMETHVANLDLLAATGLPIYITEFDIDGPTDEIQLADYQRVFPVFWEHPAIKGITLWGYGPGHWRAAQGAYIVLENGAERPAMVWLQNYVRDNVPVVTAGQSFTASESAVGGISIGTVLATDADAGATLSAWQISGGSGAALFAIDPAIGTLRLADGATLDFEAATSYTLNVSVYDGFRRSTAQAVAVRVTNANDNVPVVKAAQSFPIDGGTNHVIGTAAATDDDDTNQAGFTAFQGWRITGGTGAQVFAINAANGAIRIAKPLAIDFRRSSYSLLLAVSDGLSTSAPVSVNIPIPNKVRMCLKDRQLLVPKLAAHPLLKGGATLGNCSRR